MNYIAKNEEILSMLDFDLELEGRLQTIVGFGKDMPPMWHGYRTPRNKIQGCLSQTYFVAEVDHEGLLHIAGESQSVILQGIIGIFHYILDGALASEIDPQRVNWMEQSGLYAALTPQRQAAVRQMKQRVESLVFSV